MYVRETKTENRKTGKVYVKHTLVESVRIPKGPRQRTVMQLGRLSLARKHWPSFASELERRIVGHAEFGRLGLEPIPSVLKAADRAMVNFDERHRQKTANASDVEQAEYANIDLRTATSSLSRSVGPELLRTRCGGNWGCPPFSENWVSIGERVLWLRRSWPGG